MLTQPVRAREAGIAAVVACGIVALVFGPYVAHAGFIRDDWVWAENYLTLFKPGGFHAVVNHATDNSRTLYFLIHGLRMEAFGLDASKQLAFALLSSVLLATLFYCLLRRLSMSRWEAGAIAALSLLFPLADSVRLFATGAINPLGTAAVLAGLLIGLRGIESSGRRRVVLRIVSLLCFAIAPLIYETAVPIACASYFLYRLAAPRTTAIRWWIGDVAVTLSVLLIARTVASPEVANAPISGWPRHAVVIAAEGIGVFAFSILPQLTHIITARIVVAVTGLAGIAVVVVAVMGVRLGRRDASAAAVMKRWLVYAAWALGAAVLAYAMFIPGSLGGYHPLARGEGTRINLTVALPLAVIAFAFLQILATVITYYAGKPERRTVTAQVLTVILLLGYVVTLRADEHRWLHTSDELRALTTRVGSELQPGRTPVTVFVRGKADLASPGLPGYIDDDSLDISHELAVPLRRFGTRAFLLAPSTQLDCQGDEVVSAVQSRARGPAKGSYEFEAASGRLRPVRASCS